MNETFRNTVEHDALGNMWLMVFADAYDESIEALQELLNPTIPSQRRDELQEIYDENINWFKSEKCEQLYADSIWKTTTPADLIAQIEKVARTRYENFLIDGYYEDSKIATMVANTIWVDPEA